MPVSRLFTSTDLERFIVKNDITAELLHLPEETPSVEDAARVLGVAAQQIIKSLVFHLDGEPLLVINSGTARVDRKKLAAHLGVGRKRVKFADAHLALSITGYVVGSMPPFGHRTPIRTLVDETVFQQEQIFGGGGDIDAMMRLTPAELERVTRPERAALAEESR
jgi:Cys-tRNA(Pro) deacylase